MDVSVVIVNWNTCNALKNCLLSVFEHQSALKLEVIVVDNASQDNSVAMVKSDFPNVLLIVNSENKGFAAANNQGIAVAKGRYVLLLNSDTIILNNAVAKTVCFADSQPEAAVVGCRILNPDRSLQPSCFMFPSVLNMLLSAFYLYKLFPRNRFFGRERMSWWKRNDVREVDVVTGCFMLVRHQAIKQVGAMDERFFVYGEETDLCYRFKKIGWKIMFTPSAEIIHLSGQSTKQMAPQMTLQLRASILQFIKKHRSRLEYSLACALVWLFFALRTPLWFAKFAIKHTDDCKSRLKTYLAGMGRLLTEGGSGLCLRPEDRSCKTSRTDTAELHSVICFGGEDWWYHNRGHFDMQLMRRFARSATTVYVNSIVMQKPGLLQGKKFLRRLIRKAGSIFTGLKQTDAGFWVYSPVSLPVFHLPVLKKLNENLLTFQFHLLKRRLKLRKPLVWVACPVACNVALKMKPEKLVYQRTDRYEEFPNVDAETVKACDRKLKTCADLTVFASTDLYNAERHQCNRAILLDHGVDYELFARAHTDPLRPEDINSVPGPIVGFYGSFAQHTTDLGLLKKVTELLPHRSFVFIGDRWQQCDQLTNKQNVWTLGPKPYEQIHHYGKCFDVAIMPWKHNSWIQACNPVKLKEYLALGKPIVSTPFAELNNYRQFVYEAQTAEAFAQAIEKALDENSPRKVADRRAKVKDHTWDNKARLVLDCLVNRTTLDFVRPSSMTNIPKKLRICIACSPGGHMVQAQRLAAVYEKHEHFYFTFSGPVAQELAKTVDVRTIPNIVRSNPLSWFVGAVASARTALKEKPDVVITTGAGVVVFFCLFAKLLGAKLVFIESMARIDRPTLTARLLYPFADLFIVQWRKLLKFFPRARFAGRLL